jgi:hypothetical protein
VGRLCRQLDWWLSISKLERVVRAEDLQGMSDSSPFEGKRLRGWPVATIKGGKIIARDGKIVSKANGHYSAALSESAYFWKEPHRIDGSKLAAAIGEIPRTSLDVAVARALANLGAIAEAAP